MNTLRNFMLLILCLIIGCDKKSHIDYSSFNIKPEIIPHQKQQGFIITKNCSPFKIPSQFNNLEYTAKKLINSHWLSNPNYLEDINHLIYLFNQTHIQKADVFIQALNNSALIYKKNMTTVNITKIKLQADINQKLNYYQQELMAIDTYLDIIKTDEKQYIENISCIKKEIKEKQQYYTKLRRSLKNDLQNMSLNDTLIFDIISEIKFKYRIDKTLHCSKYLDIYENIKLISPHSCIYYNKEELISKIPKEYQYNATIIFNKYIPELWKTMVQLNGYFEPNYNKQVFDKYLQKDLMIANNNLNIKRTIKKEQSSQYLIEKLIDKNKQLNKQMADDINKELLDENNLIDISSSAFYEEITPLLNKNIKNPIMNFALLYNNKSLINSFTQEYATKILNEYPKELTFSIADNGSFTLPKIRGNHYKIVIDVKESYSVIYNSYNILTPPTDLRQNSPNTTSMEYNLNQIISQKLFRLWYNS